MIETRRLSVHCARDNADDSDGWDDRHPMFDCGGVFRVPTDGRSLPPANELLHMSLFNAVSVACINKH